MTQQSRRQLLIRAVHDAAIELARAATRDMRRALLDKKKPTPDEISAAAAARESATEKTDELWAAYAVNMASGARYAGLGRTTAEAKADAWINSHWPGGTTSALVKISTTVPDGWTFELYPSPKPKPEMLAISVPAIFEVVQRKVPDVTCDEINNTHAEPPLHGRTTAMNHAVTNRPYSAAAPSAVPDLLPGRRD